MSGTEEVKEQTEVVMEDANKSMPSTQQDPTFCTGYGIGILSYVVPVFIAEIAPKNLRGGLATLNQLMIVCGASTAYILGAVVTWRTLALTGLLPCLLILVGLFFIPESPRWLAKVGLQKEFESALRKFRGRDADMFQEAAEIQASIHTQQDQPKVSMLDLFDTKYMRPVIVGVGLMVFQQFGEINGIGYYSSETFVAAGFSSGKVGNSACAIIQMPVTVLGVILMDKTGRRPPLMVSATGTFLGCIMTAASFFLRGQSLFLEWVPILAISGVLEWGQFLGSLCQRFSCSRELGSFSKLVGCMGSFLHFQLSHELKFNWYFFDLAGFCALTVLFVAMIMPETKGKTLEEIQDPINSIELMQKIRKAEARKLLQD